MHPRQPRLHPRAGKRGRAEEQAAVLCRGARLPLRQADPGQHQDPDQKCPEGERNSFVIGFWLLFKESNKSPFSIANKQINLTFGKIMQYVVY